MKIFQGFIEGCDTDAATVTGDDLAVVFDGTVFDARANAFGNTAGFATIAILQQHGKFVAADSCQRIILANARFDTDGYFA